MSTTKLSTILNQDLSYCEPALKNTFHKEAKAVLRKLAKALGLSSSDYDLRSNKAGIAVSGEITLHTDTLYIQVSDGGYSGQEHMQVLYRTCNGRKDFSGGNNHFIAAKRLLDESFVNTLLNMA